MPQPTLALPCEYGLTVVRGVRTKETKFGDGYAQIAPDGINNEIRKYQIDTVPIADTIAIALDAQLISLKGDFFYSQFFMDDHLYKYRLSPNQWQWSSLGPNSNKFSFTVEQIYDPRN
ncbi:hypothetical protein EBS02_02145 [bacterium]|nr:hypothetical protein [bacterium]